MTPSPTKHTAEPWRVDQDCPNYFESMEGMRVGNTASAATPTMDQEYANAARIVACVNACVGMEDPAAAIEQARAALLGIAPILDNDGPLPRVYADMAPKIAEALRALGG